MKLSRIERRLKRLRRRPLARLPFGAILGKAGGAISWLLRDEFLTALAAGSVNGTDAEPGPGTRTVVDTNSWLSIASEQLHFSNQDGTWGDPGLWYEGLARIAGRLVTFHLNITTGGNKELTIGFDIDQAGDLSEAAVITRNDNNIDFASGVTDVISWSTAVDYFFTIVLRSTGAYLFRKLTGGNWLLLAVSSANSAATVYPGYGNRSVTVLDSDYIRIPIETWLPTPLAYDTFTRANGAPGNTETSGPDAQTTPVLAWNGNGTIDTNQLGVTPILGSELLTNGDFANWTADDPDSWTVTETAPTDEITEVGSGEGHGGAGTGACNFFRATLTVTIEQANPYSVGDWAMLQFNITNYISGNCQSASLGFGNISHTSSGIKLSTGRIIDAAAISIRAIANGDDFTIDDATTKQITLSSTIAAVQATTLDTFTQVEATITDDTQAGLMLRLDDPDNPQAFVHIYADRISGNIIVADVTGATTYTVRSTTAFTYSAGANLVVDLEGTNYRVYYNNALIVTGSNISTATGAYTALFATDSATRFDNLLIMPKGSSDDEYERLDKWSF